MRQVIHNCAELIERINEIGFLPLLDSGIKGFSAEEMVDEECRYVVFPDGGWDWPLWKWKGSVITDGGHVYGKFFILISKAVYRFCSVRRINISDLSVIVSFQNILKDLIGKSQDTGINLFGIFLFPRL